MSSVSFASWYIQTETYIDEAGDQAELPLQHYWQQLGIPSACINYLSDMFHMSLDMQEGMALMRTATNLTLLALQRQAEPQEEEQI